MFDSSVKCDACGRVGHPASTCDYLATAIYISAYMKNHLSPELRAKMEEEWSANWNAKLGQPVSRRPRQVLKAYMEDGNFTMDQVDGDLDWDCWPDDYSAASQE